MQRLHCRGLCNASLRCSCPTFWMMMCLAFTADNAGYSSSETFVLNNNCSCLMCLKPKIVSIRLMQETAVSDDKAEKHEMEPQTWRWTWFHHGVPSEEKKAFDQAISEAGGDSAASFRTASWHGLTEGGCRISVVSGVTRSVSTTGRSAKRVCWSTACSVPPVIRGHSDLRNLLQEPV